MDDLICCISKSNQKVYYPNSYSIELYLHNKLNLLTLITDEICAGDLILFNDSKKPSFIYKITNDKVTQIYGNSVIFEGEYTLEIFGLKKLEQIKNYLRVIFDQISLNDLITYKFDLIQTEKELIKYLLNCKSKDRFEIKKIRSIIFKAIKDVRLCEKLFSIFKIYEYDFFENEVSNIKINFESLSVQYLND